MYWFAGKGGRNGNVNFRRPLRPYDGVDRNLGSIKIKIPTFQGNNNLEVSRM